MKRTVSIFDLQCEEEFSELISTVPALFSFPGLVSTLLLPPSRTSTHSAGQPAGVVVVWCRVCQPNNCGQQCG